MAKRLGRREGWCDERDWPTRGRVNYSRDGRKDRVLGTGSNSRKFSELVEVRKAAMDLYLMSA